jgi:HB1, ASXL, restriction endonuclease HTH domain
VLEYTERPLTVGELTAVAIAEQLIKPRGRTPDRSMSSVLYRRMVSDPDAPIISENGRFWLRGRALAEQTRGFYGSGIRRVHRHAAATTRPPAAAAIRQITPLPAPPFSLPPEMRAAPAPIASISRQERAIERLDVALRRHRSRLDTYAQPMDDWDADQTRVRAVSRLLTMLGYRRVDQQPTGTTARRRADILAAGGRPVILLESFRGGHALADADAWPTIERALAAGLDWSLLTNGRELRLYSNSLASAVHGPARALVLRVRVLDWDDDQARLDTARMLFLLTRGAVADGSLDAYLIARAVGSTLLGAFDDPDSELLRALDQAVQAATGLHVALPILARQARLAIRGTRGRDGAPSPADTVSVALAYDSTRVLAAPASASSFDKTG